MESEARILGLVTQEECDALQAIFDRKTALQGLARAIAEPRGLTDSGELYERLVQDYSKTERAMRQWWLDVSTKYGWPNPSGAAWKLEFGTRLVRLFPAGAPPSSASPPA